MLSHPYRHGEVALDWASIPVVDDEAGVRALVREMQFHLFSTMVVESFSLMDLIPYAPSIMSAILKRIVVSTSKLHMPLLSLQEHQLLSVR